MGRQEHLERLALGRSAFEKPDETDDQRPDDELLGLATTLETLQDDGLAYRQQYDNKGRPVNRVTERRNELMRDAQNAVLELVGVVEKKDAIGDQLQKEYRAMREAREKVLKDEEERGESLELITTCLHVLITWWPRSLISKVQAGIYPASMSFADIVLRDLRAVQNGGAPAFFDVFLAGLPANFLCFGLKMALWIVLEEGVGRLQQWQATKLGPAASKRVKYALDYICDILIIALDVAPLPLQFHCEVRRFGLAPARPMLPPWSAVWPFTASSMHPFLWQSTSRTPVIKWLLSPAAYLLLYNFFTLEHDGIMSLSDLKSIHYPPINAPDYVITRFTRIHQDVIGRLLTFGYQLRVNTLKWFGWNLEMVTRYPTGTNELENNRIPAVAPPANTDQDQASTSDGDELVIVHRSTTLAHRPATHLADRIDEFYARFIMLPFTSLGTRIITRAFMASTLPKTTQAIAAAPLMYTPFGGGLFGSLRTSGFSITAWRDVGTYLSKLGLSLAFNCATEIGVFFIVYGLTRWQGIRNFYWRESGNCLPSRTGRLMFPPTGGVRHEIEDLHRNSG